MARPEKQEAASVAGYFIRQAAQAGFAPSIEVGSP
jgi:hypothetical protein